MLYGMDEKRTIQIRINKPSLIEDLLLSGAFVERMTAPIDGKIYHNGILCLVIPLEFYEASEEDLHSAIKEHVLSLTRGAASVFALQIAGQR